MAENRSQQPENEGKPSPETDLSSASGHVKMQSNAVKWLENFWYHYKWPTLIVVFIVVFSIICGAQMCSRDAYDCYMLYASGEASLSASERRDIVSQLEGVIEDYDNNGEKRISFEQFYVDPTMKYDQIQYVTNALSAGDTTVYLFSPEVFFFASTLADGDLLISLDDLFEGEDCPIEEGAYYRASDGTLSKKGVYFRTLPFASHPMFDVLPDDTILCFRARTMSEGGRWDANDAQAKLVKALLSVNYDMGIFYASNGTPPTSTMKTDIKTELMSLVDGQGNWNFLYYNATYKSTDKKTQQKLFEAKKKHIENVIRAGYATVYLFSPEMYEMALGFREGDALVSLDEIGGVPEDAYVTLGDTVSTKGVYVKKLSIGTLPGYDNLPEDTILCIRASTIRPEGNFTDNDAQILLLRAILAYIPPTDDEE